MKNIIVDIKGSNGAKKFVTYPAGEEIPLLSGYVSKSFFKKVGETLQLKVVFNNNDTEYLLNCIANGITYQSLVTTLINKEGIVNLYMEDVPGEYPYTLVKDKKNIV